MTDGPPPRPRPWHILTGEYPPRDGGVSDYTAAVAAGLTDAGVEVHVWTTTGATGPTFEVPGVAVHTFGSTWTGANLSRLADGLDDFQPPRRLLVQYAPNAWGQRGLNLGFCRWLVRRRRESADEIRVMFHEVAYPWLLRDRPTRWLLAAGHRVMAGDLLKAATHVDVSTLAWVPMLRRLAPGGRLAANWRPVPSNIPVIDDADAIASVRLRVAPRGETIIASFRSFTGVVAPRLADVLTRLLEGRSDRVALLIGREGDDFARRFASIRPDLASSVVATGGLSPVDASIHLSASDLAVQIYPDGVTTRRGTLMAVLSHGLATVTHSGVHTEPIWADSAALALAPTSESIAPAAELLLADPSARRRLGEAGRALYESRFSVRQTVEGLLEE